METACKTTQTVGTCGSSAKHLIRFLYHRIDLRIIFLHVLLRDFEQTSFGFLHYIVHVFSLVESLFLNVACESYELSGKVFLCYYACVVFDMCRRCHHTAQLSNIERTSNFIQVSHESQVFCHCKQVDRFLLYCQICYGCINQLMSVLVERFRFKNLTHKRVGILFNHQCTKYSLLQLRSLRLKVSIFIRKFFFTYLCCSCGSFLCSSHYIWYNFFAKIRFSYLL